MRRKLLGAQAHHEQLRPHAPLPGRLLRRPGGDRDEEASLAHAGQQRLGRLAADGVERDVRVAHRLADLLLGVVHVLLGAEPEHEVAIARRSGRRWARTPAWACELDREVAGPARGGCGRVSRVVNSNGPRARSQPPHLDPHPAARRVHPSSFPRWAATWARRPTPLKFRRRRADARYGWRRRDKAASGSWRPWPRSWYVAVAACGDDSKGEEIDRRQGRGQGHDLAGRGQPSGRRRAHLLSALHPQARQVRELGLHERRTAPQRSRPSCSLPMRRSSIKNIAVPDEVNATATVKESSGNTSTIFLVKQDGQWRIRSVTRRPEPTPPVKRKRGAAELATPRCLTYLLFGSAGRADRVGGHGPAWADRCPTSSAGRRPGAGLARRLTRAGSALDERRCRRH